MKEPNPNSLLQGLSAGRSGDDHPDADLLTAFAEGSLLTRERETVMAHLAGCGECRGVLSLSATEQPLREHEFQLVAAAAAPAVAPPVERAVAPRKRTWFPWAAAAAACLAIVSVVVVRYGRQKPEQTATVRERAAPMAAPEASKTAAVNAPAPAAPAPGAAMEQAQRDAQPLKKATRSERKDVVPSREIAGLMAHDSSSRGDVATQAAVTQDALSATNEVVQKEQAAQPVAAQASQQVTVQAEQEDLRSARMKAEAPIGGARAAAPGFGALAKSAPASLIARAQWRINAQGHVERAFGSGPWLPVLTSEKTPMHIVAAVQGTVWAGGENGVLYRSQDEGLTWQIVTLPEKNGSNHTIAHIRFENATAGSIEAADGTSWTTIDGGGTWK